MQGQRKHTIVGSITEHLVSSLRKIYLTKKENVWLIVSTKSVEPKLPKLETGRTVILGPTVSVLRAGQVQIPAVDNICPQFGKTSKIIKRNGQKLNIFHSAFTRKRFLNNLWRIEQMLEYS